MLTLHDFKISECLFSTVRVEQVNLYDNILLSSLEVQEGLKMRRGVHCLAYAYAFAHSLLVYPI